MRIALIPARGGSKRIPRKNIKSFSGKPIIAYSIEAAKKSECFDKVIVSTDDEEIANIARNLGAEIPFMRPKNLSDDHSTTMDVIRHAQDWYEANSESIEAICCLYATAPFVTAYDLKRGYKILNENKCEYVFSATTYAFPIQRAFYLDENNGVKMYQPEHLLTRSQDLNESYHDAGQFYWCSQKAIAKNLPIFETHSRAVILERNCVQDIDTPEDWSFAQALFKLNQKYI